jgi:hypothetical protein
MASEEPATATPTAKTPTAKNPTYSLVDGFAYKGPGNPKMHPRSWKPRHRLIVAMHLAGFKNIEIASRLNMTKDRVSSILSDPRARAELQTFAPLVAKNLADVHLKMQLVAPEMLDTLIDQVRTSTDERIVQKAAFGLLDRAGYTPLQKISISKAPNLDPRVEGRLLDALRETEAIEADYEIYSEPIEAVFDPDFIPVLPAGPAGPPKVPPTSPDGG